MCGIAGAMSTNLGMSDLGYVRQLMVLSVLRGWDGSGAFAVYPHHKKLRIEMHKSELCAAELACSPKFGKMVDANNAKIVCSHSRAPTRGGTDLEAIHPHRVGSLTGVHNGTMFTVMNKTIPDKDSDSLAVFQAIFEHGVEEFIKNSRGAYSLVWTNAAEGTLNFLRNDQRPMVFARIGNGDFAHTMYWSSERSMLEYVLNERGSISKNVTNYMGPKPWQHVVFPLHVKNGLKPLEVKQYEDPFKTTYSRGANFDAEYAQAWADFDKNKAASEVNDNTSGDVIPLPDRSRHFLNADQAIQQEQETGSTSNTAYRGTNAHRQMARDVLSGMVGANRADPRSLPKVEEMLGRRNLPAKGDHFPVSDDPRGINYKELVNRFGCAVCDERPKVEGLAYGENPKLHLIKFGKSGLVQYICDECVQAKNPMALTVLGSQLAAGRGIH
jgi:hypothetical protein